jgi:hypothetical protein
MPSHIFGCPDASPAFQQRNIRSSPKASHRKHHCHPPKPPSQYQVIALDPARATNPQCQSTKTHHTHPSIELEAGYHLSIHRSSTRAPQHKTELHRSTRADGYEDPTASEPASVIILGWGSMPFSYVHHRPVLWPQVA